MATIEFDNATEFNTASANPWTFAHVVGENANFLVVGECHIVSPTISGITYAGVAMTQIDVKIQGNAYASFFYLVYPTPGNNNVVITLTGAQEGSAGAVSYRHVNAVNPIGTPVTAGNSSTSISAVVTSAEGELVVDTLGGRTTSGRTFTVGALQTERYNRTPTGRGSAGSSEPGASSVTMSWTQSNSDNNALIAVPLKPALTGNQAVVVWMERAERFYRELKAGLIPQGTLEQRYREAMTI